MKTLLITLALSTFTFFTLFADRNPQFSTAGFYAVEGAPRTVHNFNVGWRFYKGDIDNAAAINFNDKTWNVVSLPHTVELVPSHGSGNTNYQGVAWYRKQFTLPNQSDKIYKLHFEAAMGKSKYYVNGQLVKEHFGGFLPITIDLTAAGVKPGESALISVMIDNSDDPIYPPGKPQYILDFCYFGGLYRDCWLIGTSPIYITNANEVNTVAGGGIFVTYDKVSEKSAMVNIKTQVQNSTKQKESITIEQDIIDMQGKLISKSSRKLTVPQNNAATLNNTITVKNPLLWHPDTPNLYMVKTSIFVGKKLVDAQMNRIGIRSVEFKGADGLYINGVAFDDKLMGANRHQDYGFIGNALSNNLHYRDALLLRNAGLRIIRSAHYPQDPAFMDACDELGLFVIVATPGWQFWNNDPIFEQRVYTDIRNMVRRDRNHPSVLLWEPILNETQFPESFAHNAYKTVHEEYPAPGCYVACDEHSKGSEMYDVLYLAPKSDEYYRKLGKSGFTREFGDCVDDWNSHNSYSRAAIDWGEGAQLRQAQHYAKKNYECSLGLDQFYKSARGHVGGTLWHSFDHQRGYHPDPFYGGLTDVFRQPKYSYFMFMSQRNPKQQLPLAESGPVIYIANELTPFSGDDIVVYSNADQVRLILWEQDTLLMDKLQGQGILHHPFIFKDAYSFIKVRALHRGRKPEKASVVAEGLIDGKVIVSTKKMPSKRSTNIKLVLDNQGIPIQANGGDVVTVIANITDPQGNIKRLSKERIVFEVLGEGELLSDERIDNNPRNTLWGMAPALIRTTTKPGQVTVIAKTLYPGLAAIQSDTLTFTTVPSAFPLLYTEEPTPIPQYRIGVGNTRTLTAEEEEHLRQVEREQSFFEATEKKPKH